MWVVKLWWIFTPDSKMRNFLFNQKKIGTFDIEKIV